MSFISLWWWLSVTECRSQPVRRAVLKTHRVRGLTIRLKEKLNPPEKMAWGIVVNVIIVNPKTSTTSAWKRRARQSLVWSARAWRRFSHLCVRKRVNSLYLFCSSHETQVNLTLLSQRPLFYFQSARSHKLYLKMPSLMSRSRTLIDK